MESTYDSTTIGLDLAKNVFHYTELNRNMKIIRQAGMRRSEVLRFFSGLDVDKVRCVAMEACGGAHFWGRKFERMGLTVKLLPPRWVKAYVLNNKTDANDSVAIAEAAQRPKLRAVAVKSAAQQDLTMLHGCRRQAIKTQTQWRNSIRAHLAERGLVTGRSKRRLDEMIKEVLAADEQALSELEISAEFISTLEYEWVQLQRIAEKVRYYTDRINAVSAGMEEVRRLQTIPGFGPIVASALVAAVGDGRAFGCGRDMAAWLGLVPRQHSSGGHHRSGGISKAGDRYVRTMLIHGARAVCRSANLDPKKQDALHDKARRVANRANQQKAVVAVANQMARIAWAVLSREVEYDAHHKAGVTKA